MSDLFGGVAQILRLLFGGGAIWQIIVLSLWVSGLALLFSALLGIPFGAVLGLHSFPGRRPVIALLYTGMGFPPVVIGLLVYLLLSRSGPLGFLNWLCTPRAMVLAQSIISFPLVAGLTMVAVQGVDPNLRAQVLSLGASTAQAT